MHPDELTGSTAAQRVAFYERQAARARGEAGRQAVAQVAALAREAERDELQARADQKRREQERVAELKAQVDQAAADVATLERQAQSAAVRREQVETDKQLDGYRAKAALVRQRRAFGLPLTAGEMKLLAMFDSET
jgi:hypothetical protein